MMHYNTSGPSSPPTSLHIILWKQSHLDQEEASCQQYLGWLHTQQNSYKTTININCGLVISTTHPGLAATPDGWVEDPLAIPSCNLVEFKNPHSYKDLTINDAIQTKKCTCLQITVSLKPLHNYYYQVQFAMFCTNTKWCDFHFRTLVDVHFERVPFNGEYCLSVLPKLKEFYFCAVLPDQHDPIREAKDWIPDKDAWMRHIETLTL